MILLADRKWDWFAPKKDGTVEFNGKRIAKMAPEKVAAAVERGAVLPPAPDGVGDVQTLTNIGYPA